MRRAEDVTFGNSQLDRAAHLRRKADQIATQDDALALAVWRGKLLMDQESCALIHLPLDHPLFNESGLGRAFLGQLDDKPIFAIDISDWEPEGLDPSAMSAFLDPTDNHHAATDANQCFREMRAVLGALTPEDAHLGATARAVFSWHNSHGFCPRCGGKTLFSDAGWQRVCTACNGTHFPRTDAVVIVLALHGNSVLLGRSPGWPDSMYSLLAGFVEPGETIEAAARREVFEESGVRLGRVSYLASQPWPFPASLMFGVKAEAQSTDITIDPEEIENARWVSKEEMVECLAGRDPSLSPARKGSIARFLIEAWMRDDLD